MARTPRGDATAAFRGGRDDVAPDEHRLAGGNDGGAVRVGDTVRRVPGPWTPAVHALLRHLEAVGFDRAPRALGADDLGREVLGFLPGTTVGSVRPWPAWVHGDDALCQVAAWMRDFHRAVAGFVPLAGAVWRTGGSWRPGLVVGHNDAAPYNAAWADGRLTGFFDWDFAGPVTPGWDLAFTAFCVGAVARPPGGGGGGLHGLRPAWSAGGSGRPPTASAGRRPAATRPSCACSTTAWRPLWTRPWTSWPAFPSGDGGCAGPPVRRPTYSLDLERG